MQFQLPMFLMSSCTTGLHPLFTSNRPLHSPRSLQQPCKGFLHATGTLPPPRPCFHLADSTISPALALITVAFLASSSCRANCHPNRPRSRKWPTPLCLRPPQGSAPVLLHPDLAQQFVMEVDTSDTGARAVLSQRSTADEKLHPCAFFSQCLSILRHRELGAAASWHFRSGVTG